jgi:hypothetical protein
LTRSRDLDDLPCDAGNNWKVSTTFITVYKSRLGDIRLKGGPRIDIFSPRGTSLGSQGQNLDLTVVYVVQAVQPLLFPDTLRIYQKWT